MAYDDSKQIPKTTTVHHDFYILLTSKTKKINETSLQAGDNWWNGEYQIVRVDKQKFTERRRVATVTVNLLVIKSNTHGHCHTIIIY